MLGKLILKILLKATIPLVMVVGVMSYGMYSRGGDPAALFSKLLGNSIQSAKSSVQGAGDAIQAVKPGSSSGSSNKTTVYKWVDANGVTQFGSRPPDGVAATSMTLKNNTNVMQAQKPLPDMTAEKQTQPGMGPDGEALPGVAGMNLPVAVDPAVLSEFLQTMQQQQQ